MRRLALTILGTLALALPATAAASTSVEQSPFDAEVLLCNGDTVHLMGTLLSTFTVTSTPSGGFAISEHFQPQGVSGVDEQTGVRFQATGLTRDISINTPAGGFVQTSLNRFHIQATLGQQSYDVSETQHITLTAAGSVSVVFDNFSATC